ncbi:MAG: hypothetical protein M3464_18595 [Chloroflexota bacterium]|nr:hypothetical protein [Chloroflexota bacterium]
MGSIPESDALEFDPADFVLDDPPFVSGLAGETEADNKNHVIARVALINLLVTDPGVRELFSKWTEETSIGRAAKLAAVCREQGDRIARILGLAHWGDVVERINPESQTIVVDVDIDDDGEAIQRELDEAGDAMESAIEEYESALSALSGEEEADHIIGEAITYVRAKWAHSWPWMPYELMECWCYSMMDLTNRTTTQKTSWLAAPWERPAAPFSTRPGEALEDAITRLAEETLAGSIDLPAGRRTDAEIIGRYVEWWYRRNIRRESINRIAGDVARERGREDDARSHVRYGIGRAQKWLAVINWVWQDEDAA